MDKNYTINNRHNVRWFCAFEVGGGDDLLLS